VTPYNIFCDESCHLELDHLGVMALGAISCPTDKVREVSVRLRELKTKHALPRTFEVKWSKVSPAKLAYYMDVIDYFFDDDDLHFRVLVVPDKSKLQHGDFSQDHDTWYYKMYFTLLRAILSPDDSYRIYLDIKDTLSEQKVQKLAEVLANAKYDFERRIIERVQQVRSHEVELVQLADLLTGAVSYANRALESSAAKVALVARIRERSKYSLVRTTLLREQKMNIFVWQPQEVGS
jgi:hypothetical protein